MLQPFMLEPVYRDYVWGGKRLRPDAEITAEAWIVYEGNKVSSGLYTGKTLAEVAEVNSEALLGSRVVAQTGTRFPLLIKLLDCASWLSLQVHPNDEQAEELEGPGNFGKTEAWYVVDADEGAQLLGGLKEGITALDMETSLRKGKILSLTQRHDVQTGDSIFIPAGMIHALGPGLLIYEVQQTSDTTYRVYDWDRPVTTGRQLHIEQAAKVLNPELRGELIPKPRQGFAGIKRLISSQYFVLDLIAGKSDAIDFEPRAGSFAAITVLDGSVRINGAGWKFALNQFETLVIPAVCNAFQMELIGQVRALRSAAL